MVKVDRTIGTSVSDGENITLVGTYHLTVVKFEVYPADKKGELIDAWRVDVGCLHGTCQDKQGNCLQRGKRKQIYFRNPSSAHRDGGDFCQRIQDRFLAVIGLIHEGDVGKDVSFDTDDADGRQFIAKLEFEEYDGKKRLAIPGTDMWHVDDPLVEGIPKDKTKLAMIPPGQRWTDAKASPPANQVGKVDTAHSEPTKPKPEVVASADSFDDV